MPGEDPTIMEIQKMSFILCEFERFCIFDINYVFKHLYSLVVLTSINNISVATGTLGQITTIILKQQEFWNILFIRVIYTLIHVGKVSIR